MSEPVSVAEPHAIDDTVRIQRRIQDETDARDAHDAAAGKAAPQQSANPPAVQVGARPVPAPPFPAQHLPKPGLESDLDPRPQFMAPDYKGSDKLLDQVALITGGDSGIGRAVAVPYAREGADVAIVYLNEHADAEETKACVEAEGRRCLLLPGDVKQAQFCNEAVAQTVQTFGKLDILVNNAAFQEHAARLEDITEEHFDQTIRTNLYGYFHMAKAALPHLPQGCELLRNV